MPALGINLLPKEKATPQQKKVVAKISLILIGILIVYVIIIAGLFAFGSYLSIQSNAVKKETAETEALIKNSQKKEILELALKRRIEEVNKLMVSRISYSSYLEKLQSLALEGTSFGNLDFRKETIQVSGSSTDVFTVNNFIDNLKKDTMFSKTLLGGLSRASNGEYRFSLDLTLANEKE